MFISEESITAFAQPTRSKEQVDSKYCFILETNHVDECIMSAGTNCVQNPVILSISNFYVQNFRIHIKATARHNTRDIN